MRPSFLLSSALLLSRMMSAQSLEAPHAEISNGSIQAKILLPDAKAGYYRGTRFDWSGAIESLTHNGHNYYGPWFTKTDPHVKDFIYDGPDIVAGPCSAAVGPVEEFGPLGYDQAKVGETFIKIGVGVLRKAAEEKYSSYHLYDIVDGGKWTARPSHDSVQFAQEVSDSASGYSYVYRKTIRLLPGKPEMIIEHTLKNSGKRAMETDVYDHNFLVLDHQTTGPDFVISVPFDIHSDHPPAAELAAIRGKQIVYLKKLSGHDTVATPVEGFGAQAADYNINIENHALKAGMKIVGNRPLEKVALWSIRSVLAMEPFVKISIQPGEEFSWEYHYTYYSTGGSR